MKKEKNIKTTISKYEKRFIIKKVAIKCFLWFSLLFLYIPVLWLIVFSFTNSVSYGNFTGFSIEPYRALFVGSNSKEIANAVGNTILIGLFSTILSIIFGTAASIAISAIKNKFVKTTYNKISETPMVNAEIITAIALMLLFSGFRAIFKIDTYVTNIISLILIHTSFCTPYVILNIMPRIKGMDKNLYEAALDLGAKPIKAIFKVIIPQLMPGIITGGLLAFTLSTNDFVITQYNISGFHTISTYIYSTFSGKKPLPAEVRALTTIIFIFLMTAITIVTVRSNKLNKKEK